MIDPANPFETIGGEPLASHQDAFLAGQWRFEAFENGEARKLLDIDPIFGKPIDAILPDVDMTPAANTPRWPSTAAPGYMLEHVEDGVAVYSPAGELVGLYAGCDIAVAPSHEGKGLGSELVVERALIFGGLPIWDLDEAAYTPAGEGAHRKAWRLLHDEAFMRRKLQDHPVLTGETPAPTM